MYRDSYIASTATDGRRWPRESKRTRCRICKINDADKELIARAWMAWIRSYSHVGCFRCLLRATSAGVNCGLQGTVACFSREKAAREAMLGDNLQRSQSSTCIELRLQDVKDLSLASRHRFQSCAHYGHRHVFSIMDRGR